MRQGMGWVAAVVLAAWMAGCGQAECPAQIDHYLWLSQAITAGTADPSGSAGETPTVLFLAGRTGFDAWLPDVDTPVEEDEAPAVAFADGEVAPASAPASQPASRPAWPPRVATSDGRSYVPWQYRRGPAYPGDFWTSFGRDGKEIMPTLGDDTLATITNPWSLAGFAAVAATGITLNNTKADLYVADHFRQHHHLNSFWDSVGDAGGSPAAHFAIMGAMYFSTLATGQVKEYEVSKTLLNTLIITDLADIVLKVSAHTDSPNGDKLGWPSGHTASSFAFATVLAEAYGPWVGVPAYAFASYVGYERLDARNHNFSDVISGAFLGMAIAHGVCQNHHARIFGFDVVPLVLPESQAVGVGFVKKF